MISELTRASMLEGHGPPRKTIPALYPERLLGLSSEVRLYHNGNVGAGTHYPSDEPQKGILEAHECRRRDFHHYQMRSAELIKW